MNYKSIKNLVENSGKSLPLSAENENGETVIIEQGAIDGMHYYSLKTAQSNGWIRINSYYSDGTIDETYTK